VGSNSADLLRFEACAHKLLVGCGHFFAILEDMARRSYLGEFELMILLALIRVGDDSYGIPISKELLKATGREVALGSVYAALDRLEAKQFVSSTLGDPTPARGGRAKRYFRITKKGVREVQIARTALMDLWRGLPRLEEKRV
jgi:PadR family transcriptional regulator PadR